MAVVGPTRMHYSQTISTVRFIAGLMSEMLETYYGEQPEAGSGKRETGTAVRQAGRGKRQPGRGRE
jgi:hypothetical protein